jgi:hypothetical protein
MKMETFIGNAISRMISEGVSVEFTKRKRVGKFGYNFFYDGTHKDYGPIPLFKIHFYNDSLEENYGIFVHEYSHFLQWQEKIPLWKIAQKSNKRFDDWLQQKTNEIDIEDIRNIQRLELDCDKRAIQCIKDNNLLIDIPSYIKESNGYIMSHNIMVKSRTFFVSASYSDPEVVQYIPEEHLTEDQLDYCPVEFSEAFLKKSLE